MTKLEAAIALRAAYRAFRRNCKSSKYLARSPDLRFFCAEAKGWCLLPNQGTVARTAWRPRTKSATAYAVIK